MIAIEYFSGAAVAVAMVAGTGFGLWVKSLSREEAASAFAGLIRGELAIFKATLIVELNGTYLRSMGSTLSGKEIERNLERLEVAADADSYRMSGRASGRRQGEN